MPKCSRCGGSTENTFRFAGVLAGCSIEGVICAECNKLLLENPKRFFDEWSRGGWMRWTRRMFNTLFPKWYAHPVEVSPGQFRTEWYLSWR